MRTWISAAALLAALIAGVLFPGGILVAHPAICPYHASSANLIREGR